MRANFDFCPESSESEDEEERNKAPSPEGFHSTMALIAATFAAGVPLVNGNTCQGANGPIPASSAKVSYEDECDVESQRKRPSFLEKHGRMASVEFFHTMGKKIKKTHGNLKRSRLIHLFYILVLPAYTLLGAWIFQVLDKDHDNEAIYNYTVRCNDTRETAIQQLRHNCTQLSFEECEHQILRAIEAVDSCLRRWHDTHMKPTHSLGEYANAVIYATSIYTTIGYGNIAAHTFGARLATIIYAVLGIPLFFAFLKDQGQLFSVIFMRSWKLIKHAYGSCPQVLKQGRQEDCDREIVVTIPNEVPDINVQPPSRNITPDQASKRSFQPTHLHLNHSRETSDGSTPPHTPALFSDRSFETRMQRSMSGITQDSMGKMVNRKRQVREQRKVLIWAVIFLLIYLFLGSLLLMAMEPTWDLFTSIYFVFQSIALIGFGDVFPKNPSVVLINFFFITIGIVLFGMCYFILQEEIRQKAFSASHKLRTSLQKRRISRSMLTRFRGQAYFPTNHNSPIDEKPTESYWRKFSLTRAQDSNQNITTSSSRSPIISIKSCSNDTPVFSPRSDTGVSDKSVSDSRVSDSCRGDIVLDKDLVGRKKAPKLKDVERKEGKEKEGKEKEGKEGKTKAPKAPKAMMEDFLTPRTPNTNTLDTPKMQFNFLQLPPTDA